MSGLTLLEKTEFSPLNKSTPPAYLYTESSMSPKVSHDDDAVLVSADEYWRAVPVLDGAMYVLQVIGLVLNTTNIIVMTRRSMRSPTTTFLVALSVLQLVYITVGLVPAVHRIFKPLVITDAFYLINSIYVINYGMTCLRRSMYCIQCCVSVERLLAVWLPLKAKQFLLVRRPWLFVFTTPVFIFLIHVPSTLRVEVFETTNQRNETIHSFRYTEHYRSNRKHFDNMGIALKTIFVYLTLVMLITTNLAMTGVVKRYASMRRQMKTNVDVDVAQKRETQMTVTIMVSTLIFVVLCLPTVTYALAVDVAPRSYGPFSVNRYFFLFMQKIGGVLFGVAFFTDFFSYVSLSSAYRNTLLCMLKITKEPEALFGTRSGLKIKTSSHP